ncbi:MAG: hypothetical protein EBV87_03950 [Alphaproteobacteria bacterium]|nr:hypothetical protein [Alphaproteobacteria bacterium]
MAELLTSTPMPSPLIKLILARISCLPIISANNIAAQYLAADHCRRLYLNDGGVNLEMRKNGWLGR